MSDQRELSPEEALLNRFLDDELSDEEQAELEALLASDPDLAQAHRELSSIGGMLRAHLSEAVDEVDFSTFYAGIESQLEDEAAPTPAVQPERTQLEAEDRGVIAQMVDWLSMNWLPVAATAAALVMGVWFYGNEPDAAGGAPESVLVDAIDNQGNKTILVSMPAQDGESTVIWLLEEEESDETPIDGEDPI